MMRELLAPSGQLFVSFDARLDLYYRFRGRPVNETLRAAILPRPRTETILMLNNMLPGWVPKWVLLGAGLCVAYLAAWFGENYAPLVVTGVMPGLQVLGYSVTPDIQMFASGAIWALMFAGLVATFLATFLYIFHFLQGKINTRPAKFQIFFLMLVLCVCMIGFGAWLHPLSAWSSNPWLNGGFRSHGAGLFFLRFLFAFSFHLFAIFLHLLVCRLFLLCCCHCHGASSFLRIRNRTSTS
jgi:hypothetical protein